MTLDDLFDRCMPIPESGCWVWMGRINQNGYAERGKRTRVHREAYEIRNGKIPPGLVTDHLCRVRCCINPDHMEAVTPRVNTLRGDGLTAHQARQTHCKRGHLLDEANTRIWRRMRICRACHSERMRRFRS